MNWCHSARVRLRRTTRQSRCEMARASMLEGTGVNVTVPLSAPLTAVWPSGLKATDRIPPV